MTDFQTELEKRQMTWDRFIKSSFVIAGVIAIAMILMWIFLL